MDKMFVSIYVLMILCLHQVTGMQLSFNRESVDLGTAVDFVMTCSMDGVRDFDSLTVLQIKRLKEGTEYETLAVIREVAGVKEPAFTDPKLGDLNTKEATVGGSYNTANPRLSTLTLTFKVSRMVCSDERQYVCEASIVAITDGNVVVENLQDSKNLTVKAPPLTPITMNAKNITSGFDIPSQGFAPTNMASFMQDQMVQLTCIGSIGSDMNTVFSWRKTDRFGQLATFNPGFGNKEDGTAGNFANCQYQRTAWVKYNMTSADVDRDSTNPLYFECYIQTSSYSTPVADRPKFYIHVYNENQGGSAGGSTGGNGGALSAGPIAGIVVGVVVLLVIIILVAYFLWFRRRGAGEDYTTKEEMGSSNPNLAPTYAVPDKAAKKSKTDSEDKHKPKPKPRPGQELHYAELDLNAHPPKAPRRKKHQEPVEYAEKRGYDNDAIDEPRDTRHNDRSRRYDNGREGRGGRTNYSMDRDDDEDYHSRDGSPTMTHTNHMGMDPVDGSIGTGV